MLHLKSVKLVNKQNILGQSYPFNLPLIQSFEGLTFDVPVVFFVGENGTGKSTLLEAMAAAAQLITVGSEFPYSDKGLQDYLKLIWKVKTRKGFFLRADDFINYINRLSSTRKEMKDELERVEEEYKDRSSFSRGLASMPFARSLNEMESLYEGGLEIRSHGESFLQFFQSRIKPNGIYLLDEPETPLSPLKQLTFLSILKEMVKQDCQFIIATHSPILMAFPDAKIFSFDSVPPQQTDYKELEHVKITKSFLNNPQQFIRHL